MDETRREHIIVAGKAFALCVLLMSFSGSITATSGVEYFQPSSFVLCGLVATAFFGYVNILVEFVKSVVGDTTYQIC